MGIKSVSAVDFLCVKTAGSVVSAAGERGPGIAKPAVFLEDDAFLPPNRAKSSPGIDFGSLGTSRSPRA